MSADPSTTMTEEDRMAAEWAAALQEGQPAAEVASEVRPPAETVAPAQFTNFTPSSAAGSGNDLNMILDIPVQLTV
jgi:flagellar motor switch protein FliN/FliY